MLAHRNRVVAQNPRVEEVAVLRRGAVGGRVGFVVVCLRGAGGGAAAGVEGLCLFGKLGMFEM